MNLEPIVSKNIRQRAPDLFKIGRGSIIDDFCYISARLEIGEFTHMANGCSVGGGGKERLCRIGDYSSISAGVKIWCGSDDFAQDIVCLAPPECGDIKDHFISGDVIFENMNAVGANSVIMPDNIIPEGTVIGALSYVPPKFKFEKWAVYAGTPIKFVKLRNRDNVLRQRDLIVQRLRPSTWV